MPPRAPGTLRSCARCLTAALLVVVQLVMLLASLTELRVAPGGSPHSTLVPASARAIAAAAAVADQRARHDEATCPACIVRSLHARLEVPSALPAMYVQQAEPALPGLASDPRTTTPSSNLSRAPPVAG